MRRFLLSPFLALALLLPGAARSQLFFGGGGVQHVATNAQLALASITAYPAGVWRDDYAAGNGAPPLFYRPSASNCTLNAGAGDNGSQVAASGGGCWLAAFPTGLIDIREFGAIADNSTDTTTPFLNAIKAQQGSTMVGVFISAGKFRFATGAAYTFPGTGTTNATSTTVTIRGAGPEVTQLIWPNASGGISLTFNETAESGTVASNAAIITDLSFLTGVVGGGTGLSIAQNATPLVGPAKTPLSVLQNLAFHGTDDYPATFYWNAGVNIQKASNFNVISVMVTGNNALSGNCFETGGTSSDIGVVYNFIGVTFNYCNKGLSIDTQLQGITISGGSNFVGNNYGVYMGAATNGAQLTIADNSFNNAVANLYLLGWPLTFVHDNAFLMAANNSIGINLPGTASQTTIHHNTFTTVGSVTGTVGIDFSSPPNSGGSIAVTDNLFYKNAIGIWFPNAGTYDVLQVNNLFDATVVAPYGIVASALSIPDPNNMSVGSGIPFSRIMACDAAHFGRKTAIVDSTTTTFGATVTGGGANHVMMQCVNGNWKVSGS